MLLFMAEGAGHLAWLTRRYFPALHKSACFVVRQLTLPPTTG